MAERFAGQSICPACLVSGGFREFDGRSLAIPDEAHVVAPDSGPPAAPGQSGPYVITGLQWLDDPTAGAPTATNAFTLNLADASAVRLDLTRMSIDAAAPISGSVTTSDDLDLRLDGGWTTPPAVTIDGQAVSASLEAGLLHVPVPAGTHEIVVTPGPDEPDQVATALELSVTGNGTNRTLTAVLDDIEGNAISGRTITFYADGTEIGTALTDESGRASVTAPSGFRGGAHVYEARFAGDDFYLGSSDSETTKG